MVSCDPQVNVEGDDYVCGWDETDSFCTGHHCDNCLISLCSSECGDEYCARTRSPADKENNQCMLCAYPLEDGEEFDNELNTWVKNGETIVWDGWSFSYPSDADYGEEKAIGGAIHQQTRHFGRKLRKGAETFEAYKPKKVKRVQKIDPSRMSGTSLHGYIKTSRTELRKTFGNPNMGPSGDGKVKSSGWVVSIDGKVATIYDRRDADKKGDKFFHIGGRDMFAPIIVAQELSKTRGEKVHAIETSSEWDDEKSFKENMKRNRDFPDSHPIITPERAMEYSRNVARYGAEGEDFRADDMKTTVRSLITWIRNKPNPNRYTDAPDDATQLPKGDYLITNTIDTYYNLNNKNPDKWVKEEVPFTYDGIRLKEGDIITLKGTSTLYYDTISNWEVCNYQYKNRKYEPSIDKNVIRGVRGIGPKALPDGSWEYLGKTPYAYDKWIAQPENRRKVADAMRMNISYLRDNEIQWKDKKEAEGLEFTDWANQETKHHGKTSLKDWADHEIKTHGGKMSFQDWAKHEDKSHIRRYGAEELKRDSCCCGATKTNPCACMIQGVMECSATCPCSLEKKGAETFEDSWEKGVIRLAIDSGCFSDEYAEWVSRQIDGASSTLNNPRFKKIIDKRWGLNAENWGGDPKGKLAQALAKAREKAKKVGKTLKIEKLDAENYRYVKPVPISHSGGGHKYNGYYAIKGYEKPTKDGFTYRILSSPGTKDWYRVYVYDDEKMFQNKSRRLNPSGKMVGSSNPASHLIGSFPRLDDAKRALVFRMIQDEQYYHILSDGNLNWLLYGKNPGSRKWKGEGIGQWEIGEQLEEAQMNAESDCPFCSGKIDFEEAYIELPRSLCDGCYDAVMEKRYDHAYSAESFSAPTKGIDTFTKPFEESSLDSGTVKSVLVGLGIGGLALFGYNKWK